MTVGRGDFFAEALGDCDLFIDGGVRGDVCDPAA
jgi:hypothetical protein